MSLQDQIVRYYDQDSNSLDRPSALRVFNELKFFLNAGEVRAANRTADGWTVNDWVKKGIILGFRLGELVDLSERGQFRYFDKSTYPPKRITLDNGVRIVPGGTSVRDGSYVARGVVIMPPAYVNVGAYVDEGTMVDSHALVGSCAQIGKRVHLSAACQIGGVLEPVGALPVIIEDDVFVGGQCGVYEGTIVQRRAVLGAGVVLTGSSRIFDLPKKRVYERKKGSALIVPEGAVVVQGSRKLDKAFGKTHGLSVSTPIIVKYRDEKTDASTALEESLR